MSELPEIAPMMRGGVGYCDAECPQFDFEHSTLTEPEKTICGSCHWQGNMGDTPWACPVWATRTAARLEAVEAQLAAWESQDAHEGMDCYLRTKRLEAVEAWAGGVLLHMKVDKDLGRAEAWMLEAISTYPGKQPTSRQITKDGQ